MIIMADSIALHTLANSCRYTIPCIPLRTLIPYLFQLTRFQETFKVSMLIHRVREASFTVALELVLARIFTNLLSLVEKGVTVTQEGLLQPSMSQGNTRVIFTTISWINKGPRLGTRWQTSFITTLCKVFVKHHTIWTLVTFWFGSYITAGEKPLWVIVVHAKYIWPLTSALCWFIRIAHTTSKFTFVCAVMILDAVTNEGLSFYTHDQSLAINAEETVRLSFTQMRERRVTHRNTTFLSQTERKGILIHFKSNSL